MGILPRWPDHSGEKKCVIYPDLYCLDQGAAIITTSMLHKSRCLKSSQYTICDPLDASLFWRSLYCNWFSWNWLKLAAAILSIPVSLGARTLSLDHQKKCTACHLRDGAGSNSGEAYQKLPFLGVSFDQTCFISCFNPIWGEDVQVGQFVFGWIVTTRNMIMLFKKNQWMLVILYDRLL